MRPRAKVWALLASLAFAASCSAIVNGRLNKKPERPDGSVGGPCMTPADCNDGNACNGVEGCEMNACTAGTPAADGSNCDDGNPMTHNVCLMAACAVGRCGDRYADSTAMPPEQCDDGNTANDDGCDNDCTFSCETAIDCQDDNPCNGAERCGTDTGMAHICQPAPRNLANGTPCDLMPGVGRCMDGACVM